MRGSYVATYLASYNSTCTYRIPRNINTYTFTNQVSGETCHHLYLGSCNLLPLPVTIPSPRNHHYQINKQINNCIVRMKETQAGSTETRQFALKRAFGSMTWFCLFCSEKNSCFANDDRWETRSQLKKRDDWMARTRREACARGGGRHRKRTRRRRNPIFISSGEASADWLR